MDNKNFPFNIFNSGLLDSSVTCLQEMKEREELANTIADKVMVLLDGLTLDEVDHVMMVLRGKCHAKAVVDYKLEK